MKIKTTALSIHELGQRSNQEDSLYPDKGRSTFSSDLYILCDGMGGHEKGEVASSTVCSVMSEYITENEIVGAEFTEDDFQTALDAAYDRLEILDDDSVKKMGTTLTFLKFHKGGCLAAHIGDSRIYQVRPSAKEVLFKTRDHSLVNDLVAIGEITEEEARTHSQKNVITRAIQPGQERRAIADIAHISDIEPGDYFFMCSDGILEQMTDENLVNILSMDNTDEKKREIITSVTEDNKDNHTAHIIRVLSVRGEEAAVLADENEHKAGVLNRHKRHVMPIMVFILLAAFLAIVLWVRNPTVKGNRTSSRQDKTEEVDSNGQRKKDNRVKDSREKALSIEKGRPEIIA